MKAILWTCPNLACQKKHAICVMNGVDSAKVGVICDGFKKPKFLAVNLQLMDDEMELVPQHYTPSARKKLELRANMQFVMPLVKDGEAVERGIGDLLVPRAAVEGLESEIDAEIKACKEIDDKISELEAKRREHKDRLAKLGAKLSEIKTGELFK